ncbi:hypothetical protein LSH36_859g02037 [Paralvinella palmiformis]|uniref:Uncharacterized protein n=1 Tax=Paralvinella palmiformis TaxID=53620 RepID=A0AAD9IZ51_9ANNE|nr:hypothetical protein LSH36_859g02037 [Paralvinella palmiformis]
MLTWEKVSLCLQLDVVPDAMRAKYCQLINELFINVGTNYSIYDHQHSCVVYDELDIKDPAKELDFMRTQVSNILVDMLDGKTDRPFTPERGKKKGIPKDVQKKFQYYTKYERFMENDQSDLIAAIKISCSDRQSTVFQQLFDPDYDPFSKNTSGTPKQRKVVLQRLRQLFDSTVLLDGNKLPPILMDLLKYQSNELARKALDSLDRYYSSRLFDCRCKADSYKMMTQKIMLNHDNNHAIYKDVFDHLDVLIGARGVQDEITRGLSQVFRNNRALCVRINAHYLERLVKLAFECADTVPGYGRLLSVLVKPSVHGQPLKRNQTYVIKYVAQYFNQATFPLDKTRSVSVKRPFIKFFHNVYFKSSVDFWDNSIVEMFRNRLVYFDGTDEESRKAIFSFVFDGFLPLVENLGEAMLPYMIDRHYLKQLVLALIAATDIQEDHQQAVQMFLYDVTDQLISSSGHSRDIYDGANTVGVQLNCKEKLIRNKGNVTVDVKGLKILRCMIYNEIVKLPDKWNEEPLKYSRQIQRVRDIQRALVDMGVISKVMYLFGSRHSRIIDEALSFLCILLFDANIYIQEIDDVTKEEDKAINEKESRISYNVLQSKDSGYYP